VCRAGFRQSSQCSRCAADLGPLMRLSLQAYRLRDRCRSHLESDHPQEALRLAQEAESLCSTPSGQALGRLARLLIHRKF